MALTYDDCLALSGLTEEEVQALAQHEHIPEIVAAELGNYLEQNEQGEMVLKGYIMNDIEECRRKGASERAETLEKVLRHFIVTHPRCRDSND